MGEERIWDITNTLTPLLLLIKSESLVKPSADGIWCLLLHRVFHCNLFTQVWALRYNSVFSLESVQREKNSCFISLFVTSSSCFLFRSFFFCWMLPHLLFLISAKHLPQLLSCTPPFILPFIFCFPGDSSYLPSPQLGAISCGIYRLARCLIRLI